MNVSSQNAALQSNPVIIQPIERPQEKPELSPENRLKVQNYVQNAVDSKATEAQDKRDTQRAAVVGLAGLESKKSQVEIYLSVATEDNVSIQNNTINSLETYRDIQRQNNAVQAYAANQEKRPELFS